MKSKIKKTLLSQNNLAEVSGGGIFRTVGGSAKNLWQQALINREDRKKPTGAQSS
jgi:hypothetical protein